MANVIALPYYGHDWRLGLPSSRRYSYSWGPLAWLYPSEIFQLEVRSAGQVR